MKSFYALGLMHFIRDNKKLDDKGETMTTLNVEISSYIDYLQGNCENTRLIAHIIHGGRDERFQVEMVLGTTEPKLCRILHGRGDERKINP
jgi:broad-specificity NMP kinase